MNVPVIVIDGVTKLPPEANGGVVVGGSNATAYAAYFSAKGGARAAIHRDCGIGRDEAKLAAACGVENGQTVAQAVELLKAAPWPHDANVEAPVERRTFVHGVLCIGSISLGTSEDAGLVVASGSHGGVTAAPMTSAFKPRLAFFNDAGFGVDRTGAACLPILNSDGIAAATVAADSACIGDDESTLTQGIISAVNETAHRLGARVGEPALTIARTVAGGV